MPMHSARAGLRWIPARQPQIYEFTQNDSPPYASGCSFQFLEVSECAFLMPVEHQS